MPKFDELINSFAVYEDSTEFYGMAEVTLPEISSLTEEIKGAGIAGSFESVVTGHVEAMALTLNFRTVTSAAIKLCTPENHNIDLRVAQQEFDTSTGRSKTVNVKHILTVRPKKFNPGKVANGSSAEASGEYSVSYFATYIAGKKVMEIDILNFIYFINGTDYLADIKKALGK